MSRLNISLLGGFEASLDGQPLTAFGADKARALLAYLVIETDRPHRRSALAALLWPESSTQKAAHSLSQTLLRLRRALGEDAPTAAQPFLLADNQEIRFNLLSNFRLDVTDFLELLHAQRQHQHQQNALCHICVGWLEQAVTLYKGDFLAGFSLRDSVFFEEWHLMQQEALHGQIIDVLTLLTTYYEQHGEPEKVRDYARRLVTFEPWQERPQLQLMTALAQCGQGDAALEQYAAFSRTLREEFGMTPSTQARALFEQIRASHAGGPSLPGISKSAASPSGLAEHGERRQVTTLVCGRYMPTDSHDPEEQLELLARCREQCNAILERHGGLRQPRQGTECLVYFGYPVAQEDAARRAAQAGLALLTTASIAGHICIGIHTGTMVVSAVELLGDTPNLARACQRLAPPNSVLATEDTERVIRGWFECQKIAAFSVSGSTDTVRAYCVKGQVATPNHIAWLAQRRQLSRFVGREQELAQLSALLEDVRMGHGRVVAVSGEAGVGKSRLVWELRQRDTWPGVWIESRCTLYFQNTSLFPLIDLIEQLFAFQPDDPPQARCEKLDRALEQLGMAQPANTWLLALLLGLPTDTPAPQTITEELRQRIRETCLALLTRYASIQPVVLVIEDLHWADPSTVAWLSASIESLAATRCFTLLTYRPSFTPPWLPRPQLFRLALEPLHPEQVALLVSNLAGGANVSAETRQRIIALADGNPLFAEELTRTLLEADAQADEGKIPTTLRDSLLARLDRAGVARETVGWAAVLGREFAYPVLAAVTPYNEQRLQSDLLTLLETDLIRPAGDASPVLYAFRHVLIQETAYAALLKDTRQAHHRRIAEVLAMQFPQLAEAQPEVLAEHYNRAGQLDLAAGQWLRAGERAAKQGAAQEARAFFERALEAIAPEDHARRWRALLGREEILFLAGERAAEQADTAALLALAEKCANQEWRAEALLRQIRYLNAVGDYPKMLPLADDAIAAAQAAEELGLQARALCQKAVALTRLGDPMAKQVVEAAVAYGQAAQDEWVTAFAAGMLAMHMAYTGDYARAAQIWKQVLAMVRQCGDQSLESRALSNLGAAHQYLGRFEEAQRYLEEGIALCDLIGDRHSRAYNVVNLGGVMLLRGELTAAKRLLEQGLDEADALADASLRAGMLWDLGWLAEMVGEYDRAVPYLKAARQSYVELEMLARQMETDARLAKCMLGQGCPETARAYALAVWDYLREHGALAMDEALPTYLALAEVFEVLGDEEITCSIVDTGYALVMARAAQISDSLWRQPFLENVPSNQAMVARWRRMNSSRCM